MMLRLFVAIRRRGEALQCNQIGPKCICIRGIDPEDYGAVLDAEGSTEPSWGWASIEIIRSNCSRHPTWKKSKGICCLSTPGLMDIWWRPRDKSSSMYDTKTKEMISATFSPSKQTPQRTLILNNIWRSAAVSRDSGSRHRWIYVCSCTHPVCYQQTSRELEKSRRCWTTI